MLLDTLSSYAMFLFILLGYFQLLTNILLHLVFYCFQFPVDSCFFSFTLLFSSFSRTVITSIFSYTCYILFSAFCYFLSLIKVCLLLLLDKLLLLQLWVFCSCFQLLQFCLLKFLAIHLLLQFFTFANCSILATLNFFSLYTILLHFAKPLLFFILCCFCLQLPQVFLVLHSLCPFQYLASFLLLSVTLLLHLAFGQPFATFDFQLNFF